MGAETGATSSIFPADEQVQAFLTAQQRAAAYTPLLPDEDAVYDGRIEIDLSALEPLIACPRCRRKKPHGFRSSGGRTSSPCPCRKPRWIT